MMSAERITNHDFQCALVWEIRALLDESHDDLDAMAANDLHWMKADLENTDNLRRMAHLADKIRARVALEFPWRQLEERRP